MLPNLTAAYRTQHRQAAMRSADAGVTKLRLLFVNSQKVADGVFLSEIGFYEFAKPGLATLAHAGPDSLDGGQDTCRPDAGHTGPPAGQRGAISGQQANRLPRRAYPSKNPVLPQLRCPASLRTDGG